MARSLSSRESCGSHKIQCKVSGGDTGRKWQTQKVFWDGEFAWGVEKHTTLKIRRKEKLCYMRERSRKSGHKRRFTTALKKKTMFLLLPRLCAWVECLYVDHGLPSEDALAVVDRVGVCSGSRCYSTGMGMGGAMRGSRVPSSSCWLS